MKKQLTALFTLVMISGTQVFAEATTQQGTTETPKGVTMQDLLIYGLAGLLLLLTIRIVNELFLLRQLTNKIRRQMVPGAAAEPEVEDKGFLQTLIDKLSGLKPMSQEGELIMEDHEYDGIVELKNGMPPWLQAFFAATILFGIVYFTWYIILEKGPDQYQEYNTQITVANKQKEERLKQLAMSIDETNVVALTDETSLNSGKNIFNNTCATCHGMNAEGKDGPNLTDQYWLHGGGIKNIFKTIKYGVNGKAMVSWQETLDPLQMQQVSSYILSLEGSNPPDAKGPEGPIWTGEPETSDSTAVDSLKTTTDTITK